MKLEGIANRNSLPYAEMYGLSDVRTMFRGTLRYEYSLKTRCGRLFYAVFHDPRYPGFGKLMHQFKMIGLLETQNAIRLSQWEDLTLHSLEKQLGTTVPNDAASIISALSQIIPESQTAALLDALDFLGVIPKTLMREARGSIYSGVRDRLPQVPTTAMLPIDLFATVLSHKLRYQPNERDLVILSHEIITRPNSSSASSNEPSAAEEVHVSSLVVTGTPEASAMARCVGLPVAFAALGVLDGRFAARGVHGPVLKEIYEHVLTGLEGVGLSMNESLRLQGSGRTVERTIGSSWWIDS